MISLIVFFLVNLLFIDGYINIAIREFLKLLFYGCSALLISTAKFDVVSFKRFWYFMSVFFMVVLHLIIVLRDITNMNYMGVGFILNFINVGFAFRYYDTRKKKWLFLMLYTLISVILFAHRGAIVVNLTLISYLFISTRKFERRKVISGLIILCSILTLLLISGIAEKLLEGVLSELSQINSRSIYLILRDIRNGKIFLTGREKFFRAGLDMLKDHSYVIPSGFGKFQYLTGMGSAHTILLDLPLMFGIFSLFFPILIIISIKDIRLNACDDFKQIYSCLFIYAVVELLANTAFFVDFPFWVLIGVSLTRELYFKKKVHMLAPVRQHMNFSFDPNDLRRV